MTPEDAEQEGWRKVLTEHGFAPQSRIFRWLPSDPRCHRWPASSARAEWARRMLRDTELPIGVGVNTGLAFTGFLGPIDEVSGFSAVGDAVNVAHRLGEAAGPGELIVGGDELSTGQPPSSGPGDAWEERELQVKGRDQPVHAWTLRLQPAAVA